MSWVKIIDTRDYLRLWLERNQQAQDAAPKVQEMYEEMDWAARTVEHLPRGAVGISSSQLQKYGEELYTRVTSQLPMIPPIDPTGMTWASSGTATSNSMVVALVEAMSRREIPDYETFAFQALSEYRELQESHERPELVRALLADQLPNAVAKFDSAREAYQRYKSGVGSESAAAVEMRTFLDGFQGELWQLARRDAKEQKIKSEILVERIFSSAPTRTDVEQQFAQRSALYDELSKKTKKRPSSPDYNVDALWARVLDHAFIVANALN